MILRKFNWAENSESGYVGWLMAGSPVSFDPGPGIQVAHDCFEHLNYDGTIESELMAFGAMLYIRGSTSFNYWEAQETRPRKVAPVAHIMADDLSQFLAQQGMAVEWVNTRPLDDEDDEKVIQATPREVVPLLREELECWGHKASFAETRRALRNTQHWMRRGYRLTRRRWAQDRPTLCEMFMDIERQTDMLSKHADFGDQLQVRVSLERPRYDVTIVRGGDER